NCAIYARKSTAETNGVADEAKSVARQVEHAKAYAARKGWVVGDEHVYVDDGISGAEFENRPGFVRLMAALRPRPPFDVLVMSEESRLGREMIATAYALKQLVTAGVRVFFYMEDRERTLDSPTDKVLLAVNAYAGELEREMARHRSRDAARQRATHGYVTGGRCFGYRNRRTEAGHVVRDIEPDEAETVRRIFRLCAQGKGRRRIAQVLNTEGAPAPRAQQARPKGWMPASVHAVLYREAYRGTAVWGQSQKRNVWGQVRATKRPETGWLRTAAPHLRIVSDEEWDAAHERLSSSRQNYLRHTDGKVWGKPASGVESKYLLTGMATCGACGGGMSVFSRKGSKRGQRVFYYGCPRARVDRCLNDLEVPMTVADAAALGMMSDDVLSPDVVELALTKLTDMLNGPVEDVTARRARATAKQRKAEKELANLSGAVAAGEPPETLLTAIRDRERQCRDAQAELAALEAGPQLRKAEDEIRRDALRLLEDWRGLLGKHVGTSRQLLRKLLDRERFVFYPMARGTARWYDLGVTPTLERFFGAVPQLKKAVASPRGFVDTYDEVPLSGTTRRAA
ncbi:MAG: recombinase family protein, partial [Gemmatimonadetes bacterium]|nr:recombinase family protein [Gemmatimonadota bacterium]